MIISQAIYKSFFFNIFPFVVNVRTWHLHLYKIESPIYRQGPGGSMSWVVGLPNNSYKPITNMAWVRARLCKLQTRGSALS